MIEPIYVVSGALVGVVVGLTGVGGGSLMTPLLVLAFGVPPATAVGTDLLYAAVTKTAGVAAHGSRQRIDWRVVRRLSLGSVPAAALVLAMLARSGQDGHRGGQLMSAALGAALILTALSVIFRGRLAQMRLKRKPLDERTLAWTTVLLGALLGALVSLTSVGAGALGVTALCLLYPKLPVVRIVGADIAHAVPLTLVAGLGHWMVGGVDLRMLASLLVGSIPGVVLASRLAHRMDERILRMALAAILLLVGGRLVVA